MSKKWLSADNQLGLLAFSPIFLLNSSAISGFGMALIVVTMIMLITIFIYPIRNFVSFSQRLLIVLIMGVSLALIARMLIAAEFYPFFEKLDSFFLLLVINSFILSRCESLCSENSVKMIINHIIQSSLLILFIFMLFGLIKELIGNFTILSELHLVSKSDFNGFHLIDTNAGFDFIHSSSGCFFLMGAIFAIINLFRDRPDK